MIYEDRYEMIIRVLGRTTWTQRVVLSGTHRSVRRMRLSLDTYFNSSPIYHAYVLFVEISYQAIVCIQILYPEILFTMLKGFFNHGSVIVHVLSCWEQARAFTLCHCQFSCWARAFTPFFGAPDFLLISVHVSNCNLYPLTPHSWTYREFNYRLQTRIWFICW